MLKINFLKRNDILKLIKIIKKKRKANLYFGFCLFMYG